MIQRIPGVRGAQAFLHRSAEGIAIIDPGYTGSFTAVLRFLDALEEHDDVTRLSSNADIPDAVMERLA